MKITPSKSTERLIFFALLAKLGPLQWPEL